MLKAAAFFAKIFAALAVLAVALDPAQRAGALHEILSLQQTGQLFFVAFAGLCAMALLVLMAPSDGR